MIISEQDFTDAGYDYMFSKELYEKIADDVLKVYGEDQHNQY